MRLVVDRFEENKVIMLTDNGMIVSDKDKLPDGIKEGDVLDFDDDRYTICKKETEEIKKKNIRKFNELKKKNNR